MFGGGGQATASYRAVSHRPTVAEAAPRRLRLLWLRHRPRQLLRLHRSHTAKDGGKATPHAELIAQMKANSSTAPTQTSAGHDTGVLKILLKHAKGCAYDLNGKSDQDVIFKGYRKKAKSKVQPKTLDPEWNEMIELKGTLSRFLQSGLSFQVWDKDTITFDDDLGEARVALDELRDKVHHDYVDVPLPKQGTVTFSVTWVADKATTSSPLPRRRRLCRR